MFDCDRLLKGDRRALARAITLVEDDDPQARAIIRAIYPHTGRAHVIGITGAPGYGKSTLVNAIARVYRQRGLTVGVVAVDPTSPFTGGALLGDRVRMRDLAGDPGVFIRSMASRGYLGGLARATAEVVLILDAAGYQRILVETVGVGQAEVDIARTAHTTVVVQAPGMGDEVQAIKAGILEIADVFAINKADQDGVERTEATLQMLLSMSAASAATSGREPTWAPPIVRPVGPRGVGVADHVDALEALAITQPATGRWQTRERARAAFTLHELLRDELMARLLACLPHDLLDTFLERIANRQIDPYAAVVALLAAVGPLAPCGPAGG